MEAVSRHLPSGAVIGLESLTGTDRASRTCLLYRLVQQSSCLAFITKCTTRQLKQGLCRYLLQFQCTEHLADPLSRFSSSSQSGENLQNDEVIIPWIPCSLLRVRLFKEMPSKLCAWLSRWTRLHCSFHIHLAAYLR